MDQANKLRDMVREKVDEDKASAPAISARVITITSGKGGVGKTNFTLNLAIQLVKQNKKVVIIDADFGLANIEVLCGIMPRYTFGDLISGKKSIEDVMTSGPMEVKFLSGGSGLGSLANVTERQMGLIFDSFKYLDTISDVILIDTGAGISRTVVNFIQASNETIVITTPEPTSITDAYAIIKTVKEESDSVPEFRIIVNRVDDYREGMEIYEKLSKVSERFLGIKLSYLGTVPYDPHLIKAVKKQQPVSIMYPNTESTRSIESICLKLINSDNNTKEGKGITKFIKRLINIFDK